MAGHGVGSRGGGGRAMRCGGAHRKGSHSRAKQGKRSPRGKRARAGCGRAARALKVCARFLGID
eukprot:5422607-Pleurochrysis_carterae.AAC.3